MVQWINFHNGDTGLLIRERLNDYNSSTMFAINNSESLIEDLYLRYDDIAADLTHHVNDLVNPHQVTKEQLGIGFITDVGSGVHYLNDSGTYTDPVVSIDFTDLEDTPDNYVGQQGMMLKVNATEDGLTYGSPSGVSVAWGDILGTLSNQTDLQDELDAKENLLGLGNAGQILATNQAVDGKEWIDAPNSAVWGSITGTLSSQTDLQTALDNKSPTNHTHNEYLETSGGTLTGSLDMSSNTITNIADGIQVTDVASLGQTSTMVNDLRNETDAALQDKADITYVDDHINNTSNPHNITTTQIGAYNTTEFIDVSGGTPDAAKPIVLDGNGKVHSSMIPMDSGWHNQGQFTPTAGTEYPDTTSLPSGSFWSIVGVDETNGYEFTTGDLTGEIARNGNLMIWAGGSWELRVTDMNPYDYYKLDGTHAILADFAGGGFKITNIAQSTVAGEGVEYQQWIDANTLQDTDITTAQTTADNAQTAADTAQGAIDTHSGLTDNPHSVTASQVGALTPDGDGSGLTGITSSQVGAEPTVAVGTAGQVWATNAAADGKEWIEIPDSGLPDAPSDGTPYGRQDAAWVNVEVAGSASTVQGNLDSHTGAVDNPHSVSKAQVGLGNVDDTADLDKPISTATQAALDAKVMTAQEGGVGTLLGNTLIVTQAEYDSLTPVATTMYVIVG